MGCVIFKLDSHSKIAGSRAHSFQINQNIEQTVFCATCFHNFHAKSVGFRTQTFHPGRNFHYRKDAPVKTIKLQNKLVL